MVNRFDYYTGEATTASEDFAFVESKVPACMLNLGAPDMTIFSISYLSHFIPN